MDFQPNEEQQQLADSLARLLDDHYRFDQRRAIAASARGASDAVWAHMAQLGITALGIPEAHGGLGGGNVERLPVLQALGRHLVLEPYLASTVLGATALCEAGSEAQSDALLGDVAAGAQVLAWAHDEAHAAAGDLWIETCARRGPGGWRLHGAKHLVLHAPIAQRYVVSARTHGEAGDEHGVTLFLVDARSPGCSLRPYRLIDDTPAGGLTFDGVAAEPLGDVDDGARALAALRATLDAGTAAACADMVGAMETAMSLTTAYVGTRQQFGRPIGEYQALRHRIAEMHVGLEVARSMALAVAVAADQPDAPDSATDLPRAKLLIGRQARALGHAAIQAHGGIGMTEEVAVGHCLRRIHVLDQLFGDADAQAARLARWGA